MSMILYLKPTTDSEIENLIKDPSTIEDYLDTDEGIDSMDLDKSWHGIHFLLTNSEWEGPEPLCYLLSGGTTIGDIDVGYGPARAITSQQVCSFETELAKIDKTELRKRFNPTSMTAKEIYPSIWDRSIEEDDTIGYLCSYFAELQAFVKTTNENKNGLVIWMG